MTLVSLERIERRFGDEEVLCGASLQVDEGARIGIVGDNGCGKTTLIRILAGGDEPDRGLRNARRGLRIAYAEQIPELAPGTTVREFVERGDGAFQALEARVAELERALVDRPDDARLLDEYGHSQAAFEAGGGYRRSHLCEKVLSGIGFAVADHDKDVAVLSGGEASRLVLASLMTAPAELLILDEPTNHLDLEGIEFVEGYVARYPGAVVVVSHDREFLDAVATSIVEVSGGTATRYRGNYRHYAEQRDQQLLTEARAFKNQQEFVQKEMEFIRRHMGSRMTAQAKGRLKRLQRLELLAMPRKSRRELRLTFGADVRGRSGQTMVEAEALAITLPGGRRLLENASFRLQHGETVGLCGRNGTGKSTLMRVLAGLAAPSAGTVRFAHGLRVGYFSQEVTDLPRGVAVLDVLRELDATVDEKDLRDHLALFGFRGDRVEDQVDTLSGGEKQRLSLARMTRSHYDVLCLDEPTNHLDITGREGLERALSTFPGTVLLITHDRRLLAEATDRVLCVHDRAVRSFAGGLAEMRETLAAEAQAARAANAPRPAAAPAERRPTGDRVRNPLLFQRLEERIMELEERIEDTRGEMTEPDNYRDAERMRALQQREVELQAELAEAYERWENWQ